MIVLIVVLLLCIPGVLANLVEAVECIVLSIWYVVTYPFRLVWWIVSLPFYLLRIIVITPGEWRRLSATNRTDYKYGWSLAGMILAGIAYIIVASV